MTLRRRLLPSIRRGQLKQLLQSKSALRIIEAHDGLSGVIGSSISVEDANGRQIEFDGLWVSSLTDSAAKAHPDTEVVDTSSRLQTIQEILQVTDKPIIVDGDTGGEPTQFEYFCSKLENMGVSAVVVEDKTYPKRNSLDPDSPQILDDPEKFAAKINRAKAVCLSDDFMIFTRIESFIARRGLDDAIKRAEIYLDSKADGILIHSNQATPDQVYSFMEAYKKLCAKKGVSKPVICVPTTYNHITDEEFFQKGFNIVIYANHLLRAAHKAMKDTCQTILQNKRSHEVTPNISTVKDIMEEVGFYDVKDKDAKYKQNPTPVIILASGKPKGFSDTEYKNLPVSCVPVANQPLLHWQVKTLKEEGLSNITLMTGYAKQELPAIAVETIDNSDYANTKALYSLMMARDKMQNGFIMIFGDIFFDASILKNYIMNSDSDILLLVDNSFNLKTRQSIKPTTDLVTLVDHHLTVRKPNVLTEQVAEIGSDIAVDKATHEFIGIAKFSAEGAKQLCAAYDAMSADSQKADFCTVIKQLLVNQANVEAREVNRGWSEVHNLTDIAAIEKSMNRTKNKVPELI